MRLTKRLITLVLALGFLLFCGLSLFLGWGAARTLSRAGWDLDALRSAVGPRESATVTETLALDGPVPRKLVLAATYGDVTVRGGEGSHLRVRLTKRAERKSLPEAEAAADALRVQVFREGDVLRLVGPPQALDQGGLQLSRGPTDRIDYDITLPAATEVDLGLTAGNLVLDGLRAAAAIESRFGDLRVRRVQGALTAELSAGAIDVAEVGAEGVTVTLRSRFGDVRAADVRGALTLRTESGELRAERVRAGSAPVILENRFGGIDLTDVSAGDLSVENQSGDIDLARVRVSGRLTVTGRFGDLRLSEVDAGSALLERGSGSLDWSGGRVAGSLAVKGGLGDIDLTDVLGATMTVTSEQSGDISVGLPADADLTLRLESRAGEIDSDFPLSQQSGQEGRPGRTMSGKLNAGKGRLDIIGRFGDIRLHRLPTGMR